MSATTAGALAADLPEDRRYRLKTALLGPPLTNDDLEHEKLSNTLALGVLSSDCISSSAYGTEEILHALIPVLGIAAYGVLLPVTAVVLVVLIIVTLTYRQVVQIYTEAGGSYVVARDNFGPLIAQIGAVALMLDYIVTVAVQAAAGTAALTSAFPALGPQSEWITVGVVSLLAYMNLRGLREAGRAFAFPTYFFAGSMAVVIVTGLIKEITGSLPVFDAEATPGAIEFGVHEGSLMSIGVIYVMMRAFAQGGSSLTGLEAISNGVSTFTTPRGRNARVTLVRMSVILGLLVAGVSWLAHITHAVPMQNGYPTVIAQVTEAVFGRDGFGHVLFLIVQTATMLILYTGANTPFNGFPYLANFVAADGFLPRWLRKRGHRLAFSGGIVTLTTVALTLILVVGSNVDKLVAFYAIGVFTGFALAGFGMAQYHRRHGGPGARRHVLLNGMSGAVSAIVVVIFLVTKFHEGAWLVAVMFAVLVPTLFRLHRTYVREDELLRVGKAEPMRLATKNVVIVLVDTLDLAVINALRHARSLKPSQLRCIHFVIDSAHARELQERWDGREAADLSLELHDCPDRRLDRAALMLTREVRRADPRISLTVMIPRRAYGSLAGKVLHDRTGDRMASAVTRVPGAAAMIVPFDASSESVLEEKPPAYQAGYAIALPPDAAVPEPEPVTANRGRIGALADRSRAVAVGRIARVQNSAISGSPSLTIDLVDDTGMLRAVFYGQRRIAGLEPGARVEVSGCVSTRHGMRTMANPRYTLLPSDLRHGEYVPS